MLKSRAQNILDEHPISDSDIDRFFNKVEKTEYCWFWMGSKNYKGYGYFSLGGRKGARVAAHRFSYKIHNIDEILNLHICHKCDNPSCVNPVHLFQADNKENKRDCFRKGRASKKLTHDEVKAILKDCRILKEIAEDYNVSITNIHDIKTRRVSSYMDGLLTC